MIFLLDPKNINEWAYGLGNLEEIKRYSLNKDKRIGWNYPMDYSFIAMEFERLHKEGKIHEGLRILDVGAGPGAIHGYLEDKYDIDITGIDMNHCWKENYIDFYGDMTDKDFRKEKDINDDSFDIIMAISALEHFPKKEHMAAINVCKKCIRNKGYFLSTGGASISSGENYGQFNLSKKDLCEIYNDEFEHYEYNEVLKRWRSHSEMSERYKVWKKRDEKISFISFGVIQQVLK